jgi:hypothetical protein
MPYANNDGVRVYYEVECSGLALVLHVGSLGSLDNWSRADVRGTPVARPTPPCESVVGGDEKRSRRILN